MASELGVEVEEASDMAALLEPPLPLVPILPPWPAARPPTATVLRAEAVGRLTDAIEKTARAPAPGAVIALHRGSLTYREIAGILKVSEAARVPIAH